MVLLLLAGCAGAGPAATPTATAPEPTAAPLSETPDVTAESPTAPANLDPVLADLARADDPEAFAREHDLDYRNGSVLAVIVVEEDASLPAGYEVTDRRTARANGDTLVQGYVPVSRLVDLAREPGVQHIRRPEGGLPMG